MNRAPEQGTSIVGKFEPVNPIDLKWYSRRSPQDFLRPAWVLNDYLFVWCDAHGRWNQHSAAPGEEIPGRITGRVPHHGQLPRGGEQCEGRIFYCLGTASEELAAILKRYPRTARVAPQIRRVYPSELVGDEKSVTKAYLENIGV
jgi:hypothetical protein